MKAGQTSKVPEQRNGLLIIAGHAVFLEGKWHGGYPGEEPFYEKHILEGFRMAESENYEAIALSGGHTRPHLKEINHLSEAEGMLDFAKGRGAAQEAASRILLDPWSRDSGENVFFSLLAFYREFRHWPERVGVVSWTSKGLRFQLIACGMRLAGRFHFHGVGEYPAAFLARGCAAEAKYAANIVDVAFTPPEYRLRDPLLRDETLFASKRWKRMPNEFSQNEEGSQKFMDMVADFYEAGDGIVTRALRELENLRPGSGWEAISWPWQK